MGAGITVFLADDNLIVRAGVRALLNRNPDFEIVGEAADYDELLAGAEAAAPQVLVSDIRMPPTFQREGIEAAKQVRKLHPGTGIVILSQYDEPEYAVSLLSEGAAGYAYLLKDRIADVERFTEAVRSVGQGGAALDPTVVSRLVASGSRREGALADLSPREHEVAALMAEGRSNRAIAEQLVVTERAVEKHVTSIFDKLGLGRTLTDHRRVLAVLTYVRSTPS